MPINTIAVLGRMRSGTTVLRQLLGSSHGIFDLGEVFHSLTSLPTNFWGYLGQLQKDDRQYLHPCMWNTAWNLFVEYQRSKLNVAKVAVDTKIEYFNYILRTDTIHTSFFFDSPNVRYILILRRNLLSQTLSRMRAEHTQVWGVPNKDTKQELRDRFDFIRGSARQMPLRTDDITVDPDAVFSSVTDLEAANAHILHVFAARVALTLFYEDLFDSDGRFAQSIIDAISPVCEQEPDSFDRTPVLSRQNQGGVFSGIANADELKLRFIGTPFEWMVKDK